MKVILLNGSPNERGCTYTALCEVEAILRENDIDTEIVQLGKGPVQGCTACQHCRRTGHCVFEDEIGPLGEKLAQADGIIIGSPVYYGGMTGALKATLDRLFYPNMLRLAGKPAAAVVSARRSGLVTAFQEINRYFAICCMPVVSSQYWNQVHGSKAEEVAQDEEGMQTMRTLGRNMAWMLKCIDLGKRNGIPFPEHEKRTRTNFIR